MLGQTITLLVTIALALNGATAAADDGHGVPLTFSGFHDDQYGKFSSWSSVISRGPNQITLEYAVCNFDVKVPLIYEWTGPNFGVGRGGTLPSGKCNILDRDVTAYDADTNAVIKFTQAGRAQPASAHVSKPPIDSRYLPPFIRNWLRAFYGPEGQTSQPSSCRSSIGSIPVWRYAPKHYILVPSDRYDCDPRRCVWQSGSTGCY